MSPPRRLPAETAPLNIQAQPSLQLNVDARRNVRCLNRNHLFRSIRLCFAHNALPTQSALQNWLVREQLMEAINANLLSHQIGSFQSEVPVLVEVRDPGR